MKQNLLNKLWLRVGMLVAIMTTALSGTAWADDAEFDFTSMEEAAAAAQTFTEGQITVVCSNGAVALQSSTMQLRWYANQTLTVSAASGYNITAISITKGVGDNTAATISLTSGGGTLTGGDQTGSGKVVSWSGESSEVVLTSAKQSRVTNITVTYTSTGGTPTPTNPTVSFGSHDNITLAMWDEDLNDLASGDGVEEGTEVLVTATPDFGYNVGTVSVVDADNNPVTLTANSGNWSFVMPSSNVTINATATANTNIVTLWSEDFSSFSANDVPSGGTYSYTCVDGGSATKIYNEHLAGGTAPELLVSKTNGTFTAIVPLENASGTLQLTYKANRALAVTSPTEDVTVGSQTVSDGTYTVTFSGVTTSMTSITIVFTNSGSSNTRLDDIVLRGNGQLTVVNAPTFSLAEDSFIEPQNVELSCTTDGATIYYSFDNTNWTEYATALNLTSTTTIYAKAILGGIESEVISRTYTFTSVIDVATALTTADETVVYVSGIISRVTGFSSNAITYYISDDGSETDELEVYHGKGLNGANFSAQSDLKVGDEVVVKGTLTTYNETKELASGSKLVSFNRPKGNPTIPDTDIEVAYGSTYTVTGVEGGTITVTSGNTAVATVSGLVITPVAVGTTTITIATAENEYYNAGSKTVDLTVTAPAGLETALRSKTTVFEETFAECNGTGGNDGKWSGSIASSTLTADNEDWTFANGNGANGCAKFGTGSKQGSATTPALGTAGTLTLSFKAGAWDGNSEGTTLNLSVSAGSISPTSVTLTKGEFNTYTATITNATAETKVTFAAANTNNNRFFLDDVVVSVDGDPMSVEVTLNASGYATFCSQYPLDFTDAESDGYSAWQITDIDGDNKITFEQVTGSVKGGTGLFLKGEAGATVTIPSADSSNELTGNLLVGTLAPSYFAANQIYGLAGNTFKKNSAGSIRANKAYIPAEYITVSSGAKPFTLVFEDDATGIKTIETIDNDGAIYNVAGQRLNKMQKGINIVNGKKILY